MSLLIFLLPFAAAVICIGIGRYNISPAESLGILLSPLTGREVDPQGWSVIYHVRLPRILLALAVGMGIFSLFSWLPCSWDWRRWPERA